MYQLSSFLWNMTHLSYNSFEREKQTGIVKVLEKQGRQIAL
jgi:hypothetical protein